MSPNQHGTPPVVGPQSSVHSNGSTGPEVAAAHTGDPGASRLRCLSKQGRRYLDSRAMPDLPISISS
jgi:hypothetical protein